MLRKLLKFLFVSLVGFVLVFFVESSVFAASAQPTLLTKPVNDQWRFLVAPYAWLPWISGDMTIKGQDVAVSTKPDELLKILQAVFQVHAEAAKRNWAFMVDYTYLKLKDPLDYTSPRGVPVNGNMTTKMTLVDFGVYYKFLNTYIDGRPNSLISLEALLGGRYMSLHNSLNLNIMPERSAGKSWTDPIIGGRMHYMINQFWSAVMDGDIGGFGVGSHFTWSARLLGIYNFNKNVGLALGVRALGINYSSGQGSNRFRMDTTEYGPEAGITIRW